MKIEDIPPIKIHVYTGAGTYEAPFAAYDTSTVLCKLLLLDGTYKKLNIGDDYSVTLIDTDPYGVIIDITTEDYDTATYLTIYRELPFAQTVEWENGGSLDMPLLTVSFNKMVMLLQQMYVTVTEAASASSWRGLWVGDTEYTTGEMCVDSGGSWYTCLITHVSSEDFSADVALGYWLKVLDFSEIEDSIVERVEGIYPTPVSADIGKVGVVQSDLTMSFSNELDLVSSSLSNSDIIDSTLTGCEADTPDIGDDSTKVATTAFLKLEVSPALPTGLEMKGSFVGGVYYQDTTDADHDIVFPVCRCRDYTDSIWGILSSPLIKQLDAAFVAGNNQGMRIDGSSIAAATTDYLFKMIKADRSVDIGAVNIANLANVATYVANAGYDSYAFCGIARTKAAAATITPFLFDGDLLQFYISDDTALTGYAAIPAGLSTELSLSSFIADIVRTPKVVPGTQGSAGGQGVIISNDGVHTTIYINGTYPNTGSNGIYAWHSVYANTFVVPLKTTSLYYGYGGGGSASNPLRIAIQMIGINR